MKTTEVKKVNLGTISTEEGRDQNLSNSLSKLSLLNKLSNVFFHIKTRFLELFKGKPTQNSLNLGSIFKRDIVAPGDTFISKLKNVLRSNHYAIYMHDFWGKHKLVILVYAFLLVGLLTLIALLWPVFTRMSSANAKVDTNVVEVSTPTLNTQSDANEVKRKQEELQKLNDSTAELDRILAEKEEIYIRLTELTDQPMTMQSLEEVKALQKRNDELNVILDTKYPGWDSEQV